MDKALFKALYSTLPDYHHFLRKCFEKKNEKVIFRISQVFILVNIPCAFLILEIIQKENPLNMNLNDYFVVKFCK